MAKPALSPLAPARFPDMPPIPGVALAVAATGMRYRGRDDLLVVRLPEGATGAGVFTRSGMPAAPVDWSRRALASSGGGVSGLVVNAGNANAFTGRAGEAAARATAEALASRVGAPPHSVLLASTGVIGEPFDAAPILSAIERLDEGASDWQAAATAIGTTDTFPKGAFEKTQIDGVPVTIGGIAKGSGMIQPDMATMLAFLFTDARLPAPVLHALLTAACARSFHCITVDGDTSTSDTLLLLASGAGLEHPPVADAADPRLEAFRDALERVGADLARQIVRDGEGATKFVTVEVSGAENDAAARRIALSIANSPLLKTAIAGGDPNWGRIVMAIGKSGERADRDGLQIRLGDQLVAADGMRHPDYSEARAAAHFATDDIRIQVDVAVADGCAVIWTCDLTHGYIAINADYRS